MKKKVLQTSDGSTTLHLPKWKEQYHSKHGAIQEAKHVFIQKGLMHTIDILDLNKISILEIGLGTGLNALLTYIFVENAQKYSVEYTALEAYPVTIEDVQQMNFADQLNIDKLVYTNLHSLTWEEKHTISNLFSLTKLEMKFQNLKEKHEFNLIYFDAFGPRVQPELWEEDIFELMYKALKVNGVLVTYSAKGSVRRNMQAAGFVVERIQGPPGKREMLRATKKLQ